MLQEYHGPTWRNLVYQPSGLSLHPAHSPELALVEFGRFVSLERFVYEQVPARHAVHVVASGVGVMAVDGVPCAVGPGDLFAFMPGRHHRYYDHPGTPWRFSWFTLGGLLAAEALAHLGVTPSAPLCHGEFASLLEPLFQEIELTYRHPDTPAAFPMAMAWRLIDILSRQRATPVTAPANTAEMAKALMDHHFTMALSIEEIAQRLGISRSALFRRFRDRYHVSPKEYQDAVRIARARALLRQSRSTINEIATACGYRDSHYFSRVYKHHCGHPPGKERTISGTAPLTRGGTNSGTDYLTPSPSAGAAGQIK